MSAIIDRRTSLQKPKFSIVTVVLNGEAHIENCIRSVISQDEPNLEYIIIDGGSTDNTLRIVDKYKDSITYLQSKPDGGIYHAINKGLEISRGEIIGILNSDDQYTSDAFRLVSEMHARLTSESHVIYGAIELNDSISKTQFLSHDDLIARMIFHPATFITKRTYEELGPYNHNFKVAGDYDFMLRCLRAKVDFHAIKEPLAIYTPGGFSDRNWKTSIYETTKIQGMHSNAVFFKTLLIFIVSMVKTLVLRRFPKILFWRRWK
jgi:glycosyltransferase involved in cell wall biosynthesis